MLNATLGDTVLDDFIVSDAAGWQVTSLFSNNVAGYPIDRAPFTQAAGPSGPGSVPAFQETSSSLGSVQSR